MKDEVDLDFVGLDSAVNPAADVSEVMKWFEHSVIEVAKEEF